MLLRWIVENYIRSAAGSTLRSSLSQMLLQAGLKDMPGESSAGAATRQDTEELAPPCDVLVLFALGAESGGLVDLVEAPTSARVDGFVEHACRLEGREIVIVEAGVGVEAISKAAENAIAFHRPRWVISAGFAGALDPQLKKSKAVLIDRFQLEGETEEVAANAIPEGVLTESLSALPHGKLLTVRKVVRTKKKKLRLHEETGAIACDMESHTVAIICQKLQVPLLALRIVSDSVEEELPAEIEVFLGEGSFAKKLGAAAKALWGRPQAALDLWRLHDDSIKLSDKLGKILARVIPQL